MVNVFLYKKIEISTPSYDLAYLLHQERSKISKFRFLVFTDANVSGFVKNLEVSEISGIPIDHQVWGIDRLYRLCSSESGRQQIEINFLEYMEEGIPCLETNNTETQEYKSYLCIIPGRVLADIYDKYGSQLLEGNVRSFLSTKVAVNKKIRETILKSPSMFFAFNNGVAATALDTAIVKNKKGVFVTKVKDFQIINGGQTTASLSNTMHKDKVDLSGVYVQMKLTQIGEMNEELAIEMVRNISKSSNSQNKVSDADFFSTHPFHIRIEQLSRKISAPAAAGQQYETIWFYERARGQYLQAQMRMTTAKKKVFMMRNPKLQVLTKTDLAKVRNSWDELPHIVSKGAQSNFVKFAELIDTVWNKDGIMIDEKFFQESIALTILFKHTERLVSNQPWYDGGYRANIVTYSLALLHFLLQNEFPEKNLDLMFIWNHQQVPEIITLILNIVTKAVFEKLTAENRPIMNVTQWCKREQCWKEIKEIKISMPSDVNKLLVVKKEI